MSPSTCFVVVCYCVVVLKLCLYFILCLCWSSFIQGCRVPSTRLKASDSGEYLAVGGSDGSVTVFRTDGSRLERVSCDICHDLPVTGLGFAPQGAAYSLVGAPEMVVSCSADNKIAAIKLGGIICTLE